MTPIRAVDEMLVPFPPRDVWRVLVDIGAYPTWWPPALGLRVLQCEPGLVGSAVELRPFGGRSFRCRVEALEEPSSIRTRYYGGFIEGRGDWRLLPSGSGTLVRYELDARAAGRLVAWLSFILPLGRLHSHQMKAVLRELGGAIARSKRAAEP